MGTLFVTNKPNYCHKRFAESVHSEFYHVRHYFPDGIPLMSLPINGFLNSLSLPKSDIYFAESIIDYYPIYYRNLKKCKKIILIAEDTLTMMDKMNKLKRNYILKLLNSVDGFLSISESFKRLVLNYVKKPVRVVYPFPHKDFFHVRAPTNTKNVLFIGRNDKTKGFMELVEAIKILRKDDDKWNIYLIGECSKSVKNADGVHSLGYVKNMENYFKICTYFVHPGNRDLTTPATIFEAMNSGIIPIISKGLGQDEIFRRKNLNDLILPNNNPETIAKKLEDLSQNNNRKLSKRGIKLSKDFRERGRLKIFREEFNSLVNDIEI